MTAVGLFVKDPVTAAQESAAYNAKMASDPSQVANMVITDAAGFTRFPDMSQKEQKNFTWSEIAKCDGEDGRKLYLVYKKDVYDITTYAHYHPGGPAPLKKYGGRDATAVMDASNMAPWTYVVLNKFKIGHISDSEGPDNCEKQPK